MSKQKILKSLNELIDFIENCTDEEFKQSEKEAEEYSNGNPLLIQGCYECDEILFPGYQCLNPNCAWGRENISFEKRIEIICKDRKVES